MQRSLAYVWSPDGTARELAPAAADDRAEAERRQRRLDPRRRGARRLALRGRPPSTTVTTLWNLRTGEVTTRPDVVPRRRGQRAGLDDRPQSRVGPVLSSGTRSVVLPPAEGTRTGGPTEVFEVISLSDDGRTIAGYQDAAEGKLVMVAVRWRCS